MQLDKAVKLSALKLQIELTFEDIQLINTMWTLYKQQLHNNISRPL